MKETLLGWVRRVPITAPVAFVMLVTLAWCCWGAYLLFATDWSLGEPGDFFSGAAIFLIIYVTFLQLRQMDKQDEENAESSSLRAYEVLKPEFEGVGAQIVSKLYKNDPNFSVATETNIEELIEKFKIDRSVFLRELQKTVYRDALRDACVNQNSATIIALAKRYSQLMELLVGEKGVRPRFSAAIAQTDIGLAYSAIKAAAQ